MKINTLLLLIIEIQFFCICIIIFMFILMEALCYNMFLHFDYFIIIIIHVLR
jgi:hypothetical protein